MSPRWGSDGNFGMTDDGYNHCIPSGLGAFSQISPSPEPLTSCSSSPHIGLSRRAITFTAKLNGSLLSRTEAGGYADGSGHIVTFESINRKKAMKTVSLRIPEDLNEKELLMELATMLFGKGMMTLAQAAELAGLGKAAFSKAMLSRKEMESTSGQPQPMTMAELNARTDSSMADSAAGRLTSTAQLKAEMKRW